MPLEMPVLEAFPELFRRLVDFV